jgi:hypothetical protein
MVPEGFSEVTGEGLEGGRRLVSPEGVEYTYDKGGDLIRVDAPPGVEAPPLPGSTAPAATQGAAPPEEDTSPGSSGLKQRGTKSTVANELGGHTDEDYDGTKYVYDKNGKLANRINPPGGSPVTGTQPGGGAQAPASMPQQKRGVWSTLTDPSLAGIALAAGQQLTRPRYPGETATGNAVSAVTAGYNQLAQQRAMQVAREEAARKAGLEREEQYRKNIETNSQNAQRTGQVKRWEDMSTAEQQEFGLKTAAAKQAELKQEWDQNMALLEQARKEGDTASEIQRRKDLTRIGDEQLKISERTVTNAEAKLAEDTRQFNLGRIDKNQLDQSRLALERIRSNAAATQAQAAMMRAGAEHLTPHVNTATRVVLNQINKARETAVNNGDPFTEPDDDAVTERIMQVAGGMAAKPAGPAPDPAQGVLTTSLPPVPGEETKSTNIGTMVLRQGKWVRYVPAQ